MTICRMRVASWIPKATNTHSEYVTFIAFPLQQWLQERVSMLLHTTSACLVFTWGRDKIKLITQLSIQKWLRHCATSRKVAGSIPDGVIELFHRHNPSGRTMALGSTQTLTEMSTRNISWGQSRPVRRAENLTTFMWLLSWNLEPSGPVQACNGIALLYRNINLDIELSNTKITTKVVKIDSNSSSWYGCYCIDKIW